MTQFLNSVFSIRFLASVEGAKRDFLLLWLPIALIALDVSIDYVYGIRNILLMLIASIPYIGWAFAIRNKETFNFERCLAFVIGLLFVLAVMAIAQVNPRLLSLLSFTLFVYITCVIDDSYSKEKTTSKIRKFTGK
ncbi:MAG: hypothetical protein LBQ76_08555 [Candidatus Fibromonas sp.]|jgi:hypothetical protein|nr:hypothetical protein [Candidatus Fibromonas sp.]